MRPPEPELVTTYGYTRSGTAIVARPLGREDLEACLAFARERDLSLVPAGGRNSFGDVFLRTGHLVVDLSGLDRVLDFDREAGRVVVEAGVRIPDLLARIMPEGFFLCGLSGSLWNTVGGNVGANIHGKDSWRDGNFVENVESFRMHLADGREVRLDRESDSELFHAAVGGLGLLGLVTEVTLRLRRIPSMRVETSSRRVGGFGEMLDAFEALDGARTDFAYGWVDAYGRGSQLGRGVFETARFAENGDGGDAAELRRRLQPPARVAGLRPETFWSVYRTGWDALVALRGERLFHGAMNRLKLAAAPVRERRAAPRPFPDFQYPMTRLLSHWRDKFRPRGFHEIQTLLPRPAAREGFEALLAVCRRFDVVPEVCSIRRHRDDPTLLSFKGDGLSLTVNHPLKHFPADRIGAFRDSLLDVALDHGGRIYLAKFPWIPRKTFHRMFPEAARFAAIKERVDPRGRLWSDAALPLLGPTQGA
ncbi:MAG: FAD-binding oxidoreductase [Myxococcota bacterium]|nr:FAD-binding oxidoreductase [Myxococcota bacterium]